MPLWLLRYLPHLVGGLLLGAGIFGAYSWAFDRGVSATEARYQPILLAAETARVKAEARTITIESASTRLVAQQEARHAEALKVLDDRAADFQRRYVRLLRDYDASLSGVELPTLPPGTLAAAEPAGSGERIERAGNRLADIGRRCERDAERLAGWIAWYRDQAALSQ